MISSCSPLLPAHLQVVDSSQAAQEQARPGLQHERPRDDGPRGNQQFDLLFGQQAEDLSQKIHSRVTDQSQKYSSGCERFTSLIFIIIVIYYHCQAVKLHRAKSHMSVSSMMDVTVISG